MTEWKARRFWKTVTVAPVETGYQVLLDARPVRTPGKSLLVVPTRAMADAMAAEWAAQDAEIKPLTMPVTRSANSAIERVTVFRAEVTDMLAAYAETDLLCYRAESPAILARRQADGWDPLLDWASEALDARLIATKGVLPIDQSPAALAAIKTHIAAANVFQMTALHDLITLSGSAVLGLAVAKRHLDPEVAFDLSRIDEEFQAEQWGRDEEADIATHNKRTQFLHADRFWTLSFIG
jgi:chaperone required for assembly of F1-ATPase